MREELKNKRTIINILLENIFCNNKDISLYKKLEDNYQNNFEKNRFETPKRYSFKSSDKTQDIEIVITRNRHEVLSDSDESDTNECNNDNDKLSNNVTTSISPWRVNLGNNDIKKHQHEHKSKTKKRNEKGRSVTVVVGDSIVKKVKGWELSTKDDLFVIRSFPDDMESYIKPTLKSKPERIIIHGGNNDLKNNTPQSVVDNILSLAKSSQQKNNTVLVSSIVPLCPLVTDHNLSINYSVCMRHICT